MPNTICISVISVDVLLLTSKVGSLGLNLTGILFIESGVPCALSHLLPTFLSSGADIVIFMEHDWNPTKDMQAMDRGSHVFRSFLPLSSVS